MLYSLNMASNESPIILSIIYIIQARRKTQPPLSTSLRDILAYSEMLKKLPTPSPPYSRPLDTSYQYHHLSCHHLPQAIPYPTNIISHKCSCNKYVSAINNFSSYKPVYKHVYLYSHLHIHPYSHLHIHPCKQYSIQAV